MPKLIVVTRDGRERVVEGTAGLSVMENIRDGGIDELQALCGGSCSCATCHVYVDPAFADRIRPADADEDDLLSAAGARRGTSRLSCQVELTEALDGLRVAIAPEE